MAWTQPKTWASEPLTSTDMNTHLRDNLEALKDPPSNNYELNEASNYTTTSTTFVDVDATNLSLTIVTHGGDIMVHFHGMFDHNTNGGYVFLDVDLDGTRIAGDDGFIGTQGFEWGDECRNLHAPYHRISWPGRTPLSSCGARVQVQATLLAGAGTANGDLHSQFWVREIS